MNQDATPESGETGEARDSAPLQSPATQALAVNTNALDELRADADWSPNQLRHQHWLATPEHLRDPATQKELAEELGLTEWTLSRWKSLLGYADAVLALKRSLIRSQDVAQVLDAMVKKALTGDVPACRLVLEYANVLAAVATPDERYHDRRLKSAASLPAGWPPAARVYFY